MNFNLTEKDLLRIFESAHRAWLDDFSQAKYKNNPTKYLLAKSYFSAVTGFLLANGYSIEKKDAKE